MNVPEKKVTGPCCVRCRAKSSALLPTSRQRGNVQGPRWSSRSTGAWSNTAGRSVICSIFRSLRLGRAAYKHRSAAVGQKSSRAVYSNALQQPKKRFFGAARTIPEKKNGGRQHERSVPTGSGKITGRPDWTEVISKCSKGTGNSADRTGIGGCSRKRIFPTVDIQRSSPLRRSVLARKPLAHRSGFLRKLLSQLNAVEGRWSFFIDKNGKKTKESPRNSSNR